MSEPYSPYDGLLNPAGFGVFSDEGMISGPFYTRESADKACKQDDPTGESHLYVTGVCPDHEDQPYDACEACNEEEEEEAEDANEQD